MQLKSTTDQIVDCINNMENLVSRIEDRITSVESQVRYLESQLGEFRDLIERVSKIEDKLKNDTVMKMLSPEAKLAIEEMVKHPELGLNFPE